MPTTPHLDAETLAAWVDGGLNRAEAATAEAHVSSCDRCQQLVAVMAKTDGVAAGPGNREPGADRSETWLTWLRAGWLIPLTAGVAAVGLWMIVPANRATVAPVQQVAGQAAEPTALAGARAQAPVAAQEPAASAFRADEAKPQLKALDAPASVEQKVAQADLAKNKEEKLADNAAAPPPAAAPLARGRLNAQAASREVASPNASIRWRLLDGGNVEYTADGGATWAATATGVTDQLTGGSSPASDVCWIVGKNGTVILTTDGRTFQRLAFPESMNLASVLASSNRSALVTTVDGMQFRTIDGGVTWSRP